MSSPACLIQFGAPDHDAVAFLSRERHGHPEDVLANLDGLQTVISNQPVVPDPGNIAAQFLLVDALHYVYQSTSFREIGAAVHRVVHDPERVDDRIRSILRYHAILDGETTVRDVEYVYRLRVGGFDARDWHLSISGSSVAGATAREAVESARWRRRGTLEELAGRFD